jgi:alpha-L-arabinofuranosidase
LTVAVVNPTETAHEMEFAIAGLQLQGSGTLRRIAAPNLNADNEPGKKPTLEVVETRLTERPTTLTVPPLSISLFELDVQ